jgi:hypothetical protein
MLDPASQDTFGDYPNTESNPAFESMDGDNSLTSSMSLGDSFGDKPQNVTRNQIMALFHQIDSKNRTDEKELLNILRSALNDLSAGDQAKAFDEYEQALEKSSESDPQDKAGKQDPNAITGDPSLDSLYKDSNLGANQAGSDTTDSESEGDSPTRVVNGEKFYEGQTPGQGFDLHPSFDAALTTHTVTTDGKVTITPSPSDPVTISQSGDTLVVQIVHEGKQALYKIDSKKASEVQLVADPSQVTGDTPNNDGKIKVGTLENPQTYVSKSKSNEIADKLQGALQKIGSYSSGGLNWLSFLTLAIVPVGIPIINGGRSGGKYAADSEEKTNDIKQVLPQIVSALRETDPGKKKELWSTVVETVGRWDSQESDKGHVNDRGQLLFNVLYGQLGEDGLKEALKLGIFPKEFSDELSKVVTADPGENNSKDDANRETGGPGWTHQSVADFLNRYSSGTEGTGTDSSHDNSDTKTKDNTTTSSSAAS